MSSDLLLPSLEALSRDRPDRVLRLLGTVQSAEGAEEALEILIFRGLNLTSKLLVISLPNQSSWSTYPNTVKSSP